jgi:hypothetical protein
VTAKRSYGPASGAPSLQIHKAGGKYCLTQPRLLLNTHGLPLTWRDRSEVGSILGGQAPPVQNWAMVAVMGVPETGLTTTSAAA